MIDEYWTWIFYGYHSDEISHAARKPIVAVCDICCKYRVLWMQNYYDLCSACSHSVARAKEKHPLPDGWKTKLSDITTNKKSAQWLGCIAEMLLSNVYKDVRVMPYGNPGYDFICNLDYRIDVKSSATGDKCGYWMFGIRKNTAADYFLCIAFESRADITPTHLWLIPGQDVNHLTTLSIHKSVIDKWNKYEQPIDKVIICCNEIKSANDQDNSPKSLRGDVVRKT